MQLDTDYLETQRRSRRERWRWNLAALALIGCAIMLGDLVVTAQSVEAADDPALHCPHAPSQLPTPPGDIGLTLAHGQPEAAFTLFDQTLCSGRE